VLGTLLNGAVPLLDALALARQTARNVHFSALVARPRTRSPAAAR
jgi:type II secretory pathway component PulF